MFNLLTQITSPTSQAVKNPPVADVYLFLIILLFAIAVVEVVFIIKTLIKLKDKSNTAVLGIFPPAIAMLLPLSTVKTIIVAEVVIVAVLYFLLRILMAKQQKKNGVNPQKKQEKS